MTEKLLEACAYGTVPIYFGDPTNVSWLNPAAVIRYEGPQTYDRVLEALTRGCQDFEAYKYAYEQPLLLAEPPEWSEQSIGSFLEYVVEGPRHVTSHARLYFDFYYE